MGSRVNPARINCVNCNICINKMRRYPALSLDTEVTAVICSWVHPYILTEDDHVCMVCRDLAVNNKLQEVTGSDQAAPSIKRHTNVCRLCGCSLLRRQGAKILRENPTEMQQLIIDIIVNKVAPREISSSDRVCHACMLRTKREVIRMNRQNESTPQLDTTDDVQPEENLIQPSVATPKQQQKPTQTIELPNYRRAANSTHTCVFKNCSTTSLHNIPDKLRATILHNHNYYIPKLARVCSQHLSDNSWHMLYNSENSIATFNADHIQHVFSFVNKFSPTVDFDNIQDMDERVFEYWTGLTKEKFNDLIRETPRLSEVKRGQLGLAALLMKLRTGESDEKIARLVRVPRRTLEELMKKVREIL